MKRATSQSGFSLIELLVATGLLLVVSSIVTNALMQMTHAQKTIWNRTGSGFAGRNGPPAVGPASRIMSMRPSKTSSTSAARVGGVPPVKLALGAVTGA